MKRKNFTLFSLIFLILFIFITAQFRPLPAYAAKNGAFQKSSCVKDFKAAACTDTRIKLTWRKFKKADGYQIYRSTKKKGRYVRLTTTKKSSFTNKNLKASTTYYYKIRAFQKKGKTFRYSRFGSILTAKTTSKTTAEDVVPTPGTPGFAASMRQPQNLDYSESTERILNPDQGFYRPVYVTVNESGIEYLDTSLKKNTNIYHLRIDISAFSKANNKKEDRPLTKAALNGLSSLLGLLYEQDKNAIVRFSYAPGFSGGADLEPDPDMIVTHIRQISSVLNRYPDTITAIETGMIGSCGEMHTSAIAVPEVINTLIDAYLSETDDIPVLVRTPRMIYNYLGIAFPDIDVYTADPSSKTYRLGIFNDGYLGSNTDLGTYKDRSKETTWLTQQTDHLPYGGEVTVPGSTLHNIENCLPEMKQLHLSYLNSCWNDEVLAKWKSTYYTQAVGTDASYYGKSAYEYIENHLGYRFVLTSSVFEYADTSNLLKIHLTLDNRGFGNLNRQKHLTFLLVDKNQIVTAIDGGVFSGENEISVSLPLSLTGSSYDVYLKLDNGNGHYSVRFANHLWDDEKKANFIGTVSNTGK